MAALITRQTRLVTSLCGSSRRLISTTVPNRSEDKALVEEATKPGQLNTLCGVPAEQTRDRKAVIYLPTRSAMTSGTHNMRKWVLKFDTKERWENPLMGWASTADPLSNTVLEFNTREAAMQYCDTQGWNYEVKEPSLPKLNYRSYAANFSWNKRTRLGSK